MATILDLFQKSSSELYGLSGTAIISSKGLINPPRGAALLLSSPNAFADMVGNQAAGMVKGTANRPTDTIFRNNLPFAKPISLGKTQQGLKDAVDADTPYYIKDNPAPTSVFAKFLQGTSSPQYMVANAAIKAINKIGRGSSKAVNDYSEVIKNAGSNTQLGSKLSKNKFGKVSTETVNGSEYLPKYSSYTNYRTGNVEWTTTGYDKIPNEVNKWDVVNTKISNNEIIKPNSTEQNQIEDSAYSYLKIKILGEPDTVYFNGTISGVNETFSPEWNTYNYIGSPFKVRTYSGVERELSFSFRLYFTDVNERVVTMKKLNYLTSLVYPAKNLSQITYGQGATHHVMFAPTFIILSIKSLYNNLFGCVTNLSVSVDDTVPWVNFHPTDGTGGMTVKSNTYATPSVIDIDFTMAIIDTKDTMGYGAGTGRFAYNFRNSVENENQNKPIAGKSTIPVPTSNKLMKSRWQ